ncbi:aspartic proteinase CDR1-like [Cucumis melo var. makuwa]|uniref:Aspartic proteinase CDR1-like n=1 Tax=Cucumis melo var. makuwa TaxID=1194695 RepID=A0A5D3DLM9_CUCMM|nr:aspartic proteinase CDR1-like [Cucumis melo var. makuwa]TYK24525.1 aspartic proteinase CDR1-like [Cucumis melo var. makuwa]
MAPIFSILFLISTAVFSATTARDYGFTVELIHRDSTKSPMYNSSETHYDRIANALRRSINRNKAVLTSDTAEAPIYNNGGEYLVEISIGTPPFSILAVADTGSDVIWTQCEPCSNCYQQSAPMFDPSKSATYKNVPCSSPVCSYSGDGSSCSDDSECLYSIAYGDKSHSDGNLAVDTVTMQSTSGRPVSFPRTVIGCGHDNAGTFNANVSGIVGLGRGPASLVTQLGPATGGKFSYCLMPIGNASMEDSTKLNFGSNADVSGSGAVSTPIYTSDQYKTFYSLKLEAVSVGDNKFDFPEVSSKLGGEANIIIDSGTTLTYLPSDLMSNFGSAIADSINLPRAEDPSQFLDYCFSTTTDDYEVPSVTMHFEGADVPLQRENMFIRLSEDTICLAFGAFSDDNIFIYGNIAQSNFLVGYDIKNLAVSFQPAECNAM